MVNERVGMDRVERSRGTYEKQLVRIESTFLLALPKVVR